MPDLGPEKASIANWPSVGVGGTPDTNDLIAGNLGAAYPQREVQ